MSNGMPPPPGAPVPVGPPARPTGVTVLAVLHFIVGLIWIASGGLMVMIASATSEIPLLGAAFGAIFYVCGAILLIIGIVYMLIGVGLMQLKPWAKSAAKILAIISLILGILSVLGGSVQAILNVILAAVILWYLGKPEIKAAFGEAAPMPMYQQPPPGYQPPPPGYQPPPAPPQ